MLDGGSSWLRYHWAELVEPPLPGAIISEHRVTITVDGWSADPTSDLPEAPSRPWPRRFTDGSLRQTVPKKGTDQANFDLKMRQ